METGLDDYRAAAALRAAVRAFLHRGEQAARRAGLTPQRQLLLLMIKGAPDGSETASVTELAVSPLGKGWIRAGDELAFRWLK